MADQNKEKRKLWERLRHTFRLVIMNDETFEEVGSYRLTLLNVYVVLSTLVVVVAFFVLLLVFYTPLRRYVPGYGKLDENSILFEMQRELDKLETELATHRTYSEGFRRMLVGDEPIAMKRDSILTNYELPDSMAEVTRIEEDEMLRKELELSEKERERELLSRSLNISPKDLPIEQMYFVPPVSGTISAGFTPGRQHFGVDVMAPQNTPIKAIMDGYVFFSDWTLETGHTIGIQHENNLLTFYKHNSALLKKVGSIVNAGEAIAIIGNSGTLSSGPHLHFELWHNGKPVDPEDYLNFE
jgi:murein DD-endopeptidase MepM/ murein hydrolase activator NlpD